MKSESKNLRFLIVAYRLNCSLISVFPFLDLVAFDGRP